MNIVRAAALTATVDWNEFHNCQSETNRKCDRDTPNSKHRITRFRISKRKQCHFGEATSDILTEPKNSILDNTKAYTK